MARRRHLSRIAVMQALFECEKRADADPLAGLTRATLELGEMDESFAKSLLEGILKHKGDVERAIAKNAPEWPLDRMDPISRCTLLVGAYELLFANDAPKAVVMNEAIEIAKEYGTTESGKFVNGVLNAIANKNNEMSR